mmetsp:Transcript_13975/g.16887  ORF Transcript_13975/g.16887 Transcript_13975/m.16887 type:complete len:117 (-) Transcript_13975:128-478(-)|eukprot:CAMPEP_0197845698 /NCGR_PEP_ID=MMETSP1438-20131217/2595_1 /TAXON_ID=1461541 /ORGANISM="Pterosperma sp., Strain CCMP1384" /LENGTH=116 /DNA_ID=CAMNT_0043457095 /DNA_START=227 /DNA_END=577 /DNA_ORIENTATION=+
MSGYDNVIGGKLKLKGKLNVDTSIKKKKKKKKSKELQEGQASGGGDDPTSPTETPKADTADHRTAAEKMYDERHEKMQEKRMNQFASNTHRERVAQFNKYLGNLTEHHDIPKVGPG